MAQIDHKDIRYGLAAFGASLCVQFLHPFDVIKTRMQSHDGQLKQNLVPKYGNIKQAIIKIYQDEGLKGFTRGILMSLTANSIARTLFFSFYEGKKDYFEQYFSTSTSSLLASIYASWAASFLTQPLWVILTRMQLNTQIKNGLQNIQFTIHQIYAQHGPLGFYRGFKMQMFVATHGMIQINAYEYLLHKLNSLEHKHQYYHAFFAGMLSKGFAIYITYPLTTVKTRIIQNQYIGTEQPKYNSNVDIMKKILNQEGIKGFYKGISASLVKGLPSKGLYFYFYEYMKNILKVGRKDQ